MPALLDTTILVSLVDESRADHDQCRDLVDRHPQLHLCAQSCREFIAVSTRPIAGNGLGMTSADACENVVRLQRRITLLPEERPLLDALLELVRVHGLTGRGVHDGGIVAAALAHRIPVLVTSDRQVFSRYERALHIQTPSEALAAV